MYQGDHEEYEKVQTKLSEEYNALENPDETVVLRYSLSEENNLANTQYEPNTDISSRLRTASGSSADLQLAAGNGRLLQCSCQEEGHAVKPLSSFVNVAKPVNQPKRDTVSIPVEKQWKGTKQQEVNIELLRDGVLQFNTLTLNDKNGWKGTFENLDAVYENGNAYVYTFQEAGEEPKKKRIIRRFCSKASCMMSKSPVMPRTVSSLRMPKRCTHRITTSRTVRTVATPLLRAPRIPKRTRPTASPLQKISPAHRLLLPNRLRKAAIPASVIQNRVRTLRKTAFTPV